MSDPQRQMQFTRKGRQVEAARARICAAVVVSLDRHGYAGTSINRVQELAGVSRGALTHHFPSRQALVAETAGRLLQRAIGSTESRRAALARMMESAARAARKGGADVPGAEEAGDPVAAWLLRTWDRVVNSREGRALLEILVATRTDQELHRVLAPELAAWDGRMSDAILDLFTAAEGGDEEARLLWGLCRTFLRGLLIQERFVADPAVLQLYMQRFAAIISPHLRLRSPADTQQPAHRKGGAEKPAGRRKAS